jgi:hypothetical protein
VASQGPFTGASGADDASIGTVGWSNVSNAGSSNDQYATVGLGVNKTSHYIRGTNYGFTIPAGANIDGVVVGVERKSSSTPGTHDASCRLYTGSFVGSERATATAWPTTDAYEDHGGPTDVWGVALTDAIVNASTFGFGIAVFGSLITASIDHARITVYYTVAPAGGAALSQTIVVGL